MLLPSRWIRLRVWPLLGETIWRLVFHVQRVVQRSQRGDDSGFRAEDKLAESGFLQPDGNIYLLLMGLSRATPGFAGGALTLDRVKMAVDFK